MRTKLICEKADPHENHARERRRPVPQRAGRHIGRGLGVSVSGFGPGWTESGFVPGETVQVLARGAWGGDPLAVRVGQATFALRHQEAAMVQVQTQGQS
jgi:hypothetical protein